MSSEISDVQAGFRKGRWTKDQIANIHWFIEKAREFQEKKIYFCFIDYAKAFDCVDHNKVWKILKEMSVPDNLKWGSWHATVHEVTQSQAWLSSLVTEQQQQIDILVNTKIEDVGYKTTIPTFLYILYNYMYIIYPLYTSYFYAIHFEVNKMCTY